MPGLTDGGIGPRKNDHIAGFAGIYRNNFTKLAVFRRRAGYIYLKMSEDIIDKARTIEARLWRAIGIIVVFPELRFTELNQAVFIHDHVFGFPAACSPLESGTYDDAEKDSYFKEEGHGVF